MNVTDAIHELLRRYRLKRARAALNKAIADRDEYIREYDRLVEPYFIVSAEWGVTEGSRGVPMSYLQFSKSPAYEKRVKLESEVLLARNKVARLRQRRFVF